MAMTHASLPIWIWLATAAVVVGTPAVTIAAAVLLRARASRSAVHAAGQSAGAARARASRVTRYGMAGLGVGILAGLTLIQGHVVLAVACCAGGYLAGLLLGEFAAQPPAGGPLRAARLVVRRPADYAPRWAVAAALLTAGLVLAAPIAFALAPAVHYESWHPEAGVSVTLPGGETSWPPISPSVLAAVVVTVVVLGVGTAGLHRVAARPSPADGTAHIIDEVLRRQAGRAILGAVLGLQLIMLATLLIDGSSGLAVPVPAVAPGAYLGSRIMIVAGLCCAAAGLVAWLTLSGWTRRGRQPVPPADRAPVRPGS